MTNTVAIILCAGTGIRTGLANNKILHYVGKKTVLEYTLDAFTAAKANRIVLCIQENDKAQILELTKGYSNIEITQGGNTRFASVKNGLEYLNTPVGTAQSLSRPQIAIIHDAARPFITPALINKTIQSALQYGSGILAVPTVDTIKQVENSIITVSIPRHNLYNIQTPQAFDFNDILTAYQAANPLTLYTDDSEVYAAAGYTPHIVPGDYSNIKITTKEDFFKPATINSKIGTGFDVHALVKNRPLILGGVNVPHTLGLDGHSDADVLTHAIMDALLSAANLPDIGMQFPPSDNKYKNANSIELLQEVHKKITALNYSIHNISCVVMAEKPKINPHIQAMQNRLATTLNISPTQISISATTHEGLGIIGSQKAIAASTMCLLVDV